MKFISVTPGNSWGINGLVLEGPMAMWLTSNWWHFIANKEATPPCPSFLGVFVSLVFFLLGNSLVFCQGALKGTNLRGQTEPKRRFSLILADFRWFSPFPGKQSIWEAQIFEENRRFSQETTGTRRKPQIGVCPLRFIPARAALFWGVFCLSCRFLRVPKVREILGVLRFSLAFSKRPKKRRTAQGGADSD